MWPPDYLISEEEYLVREPEAEYRSEFLEGRVTQLTGASRKHSALVTNLVVTLHQALPASCAIHIADMRVKVEAARFYTYPDLAIVCGPERFCDETQTTLTNPDILIEVLSPSTEAYDRGDKFAYYKKLPSLREYLLVAQERTLIEHWRRSDGVWSRTLLTAPGDVLQLHLGAPMSVLAVYRNVLP
jgi:Uma2 family endonuclease